MHELQIRTGARLHFGLILSAAGEEHHFAGVGLMVSSPGWHLQISMAAEQDSVSADESTRERIEILLQRIRTQHRGIPPLQIVVRDALPPHAGLGSGTQLALATVAGVLELVPPASPVTRDQIVALSGRAERSAIGSAGFFSGGFLIDRGEHVAEPRVESLPIPSHWRFILLRPEQRQGLSGHAERNWFGSRPQMPDQLVQQLTQLAQQHLQESLHEAAFERWSKALEEYGDLAGQFYARFQGHIFADAAVRNAAELLRARGVRGIAQSSWGPGICIPASDSEHADWITQQLPEVVAGTRLLHEIVTPLNTGASISYPAGDQYPHGRIC